MAETRPDAELLERKAGEGEFRSNLHRGATASGVTLEPPFEQTAVHAAEVVTTSIAANFAGWLLAAQRAIVSPTMSCSGVAKAAKVNGMRMPNR